MGAATSASAAVPTGGNLTVVMVGVEFENLDAGLDLHNVTDQQMMDAIYGDLFIQKPGGKVVPYMAKSYKYSGDTLTINLRHGMKFSDGTPYNAQAVQFSIQRDLDPKNFCGCLNDFHLVNGVTTSGEYTVVLHLSAPDPEIVQAFIDNAPNWTVSEHAVQTESPQEFAAHPIGAGPFVVQSMEPDVKVALTKNPTYWQAGHPYLDSLTFVVTNEDESAYEALQAKTAQVALGTTTPSIVNQAKSGGFQVFNLPGVTGTTLEFNTKVAPLNNIIAREAIADSINPQAIVNAVSPKFGTTFEGNSGGPGSKFFEKTVPGYHTYNLAKAQALVKQLGGLSFTLEGGTTPTQEALQEAIQSELQKAGIKLTLEPETLTVEEQHLKDGNWQSLTGGAGGVDPDLGPQSLPRRFTTTGTYSCCHDPNLDAMVAKSVQVTNLKAREALFKEINAYIAKEAYVADLYSTPTPVIAASGVGNLNPLPSASGGITTDIDWYNVFLKNA